MRLGSVIGKVTLSQCDPALRAGRFLLVQPWSRDEYASSGRAALAPGSTLVVYDALGAGTGHPIGFSEGAEATAPFDKPTPIDAYCAVLVDNVFYNPPSAPAAPGA